MSESTPNKTGNIPKNKPLSEENTESNYELISAYIDNEIYDTDLNSKIKNLIVNDLNYHNRYIFEKLTKECLQTRIKTIETPVYLYKSIGQKIDESLRKIKKESSVISDQITSEIYTKQLHSEKSNLKRYLIYGGYTLIVLIALSFVLNNFLKTNPEFRENDLVSVSRNIFDKVEKGQITPKFKTNSTKELEDSMNKYVDFKVFIPNVKDAEIIGGVCNELYGVKLAHFIHKKGNLIIYTLQADKNQVMDSKENIIICQEFKENIINGKNWFVCIKDDKNTAVIWVKDNVICSSVAHMDNEDISAILTNFK
ncbi:MAG: hypothetical protein LH629_15790 [Ignavibacteria bacterium]|nr:hypothetical protein [Ignavibacteria bacterium]